MNVRSARTIKPFHHWSPVVKILFAAFVLFGALYLLSHSTISHYFPIRKVKIYGISRISEEEFKSALKPLVDRDFFTIDVENIRDRLLDIPWISELQVRRVWPDKIVINISERTPVARWNNRQILSKNGELFTPKENRSLNDLPLFKGPEGKQLIMMRYYQRISEVLAPLHVRVSYLELTPFYSWKMSLNNGVNLHAGHKDILTRLDQFVKVYPKIVGNKAKFVDYVDLRYPNGLAVRWKEVKA